MRVDIAEVALGRWHGILTALGVDKDFLQNKHGPCPVCSGKDRFRWDNVGGRGTFFCTNCGSGDGFELLKNIKGWDFRTAAREVERVVGVSPPASFPREVSEADKVLAIKRLLKASKPVRKGDPVWKYLDRRIGISSVSPDLRYHASLPHKSGGKHPAMLAVLRDADGNGVSVHRTYLTPDGEKAAVDPVRMLMPGKSIVGSAIRLGGLSEAIGIAEGIETALAASKRFGVPVWSAVNAGMLGKWNPPKIIKSVFVFADNDENYTGQAAAYALAHRLAMQGLKVQVYIPDRVGTDWADEAGQQ